MPDNPEKSPPKPETARDHSGRDDVSHGMNNNLDPSLAPPGADQAAAQDIQDQHRTNEEEDQDEAEQRPEGD